MFKMKIIILECPRGVVASVLNCEMVISRFELQSSYYVHSRTNTFEERYEPPLSLQLWFK